MDCWCHPAGTSEARYTPWSCPCKKKARRFTHENCSQVLTPPVFPVWPKTSICLLPKGLSRAPGPGNREHRGGVCPENIVNDEEDGQDPGSVCRQGGEKHSPNYTDIIRRLIGEFSEIPLWLPRHLGDTAGLKEKASPSSPAQTPCLRF